jgi:hypothetical protein
MKLHRTFLILLVLNIAACSPPRLRPTSPSIEFTLDVPVLGYALIDMNGNGQSDATDLPLEGAQFVITPTEGRQLRKSTDTASRASVTLSFGTNDELAYFFPVTLRMEPPPNTDYILLGTEQVIANCCNPYAEFLFTRP